MPQAFAGFICGFALSILYSPIAAWALVQAAGQSAAARRVVPEQTNFLALTMVLHLIAVLLLTALGMLLGLALLGLDDRRPGSGLGSPNVAFTVLVLAVTAAAFLPLVLLAPVRRYVAPCAIVFAAVFGWAMPWLAEAG